MARMHARRKGKAGSKHPAGRVNPDWVKMSKKDCEELAVSMYKDGKSMAEIGLTLRDQYGVPSVKALCGRSVSDILKDNGIKQELPEDMMSLVKSAVFLRKHMQHNKNDLHNRRGLELIESKIKRLQKYYKRTGTLEKSWFYKPEEAALLVK
ncbi:MAG: 30S ribosomal protein S15 [Candidatus Diapherotrites archaeon]|nr:30S ribosomal protein S15 [Candidatus Diapherotrites archaeon]